MTYNRRALGFGEAVQHAFQFLITEYSFKCVEKSDTYVRYEKNKIFVSIYHGKVSYEVGLEIGLKQISMSSGFGIGSLIAIQQGKQESRFRFYVAKTRQEIVTSVDNLARLLKEYENGALDGNQDIFEQLNAFTNEVWERTRADQIKINAAKAFSEGDYLKADKLYKSIIKYLSPVENKKMQIARKRMNNAKDIK